MKRIILISSAILLLTALSFSVMAFRDDEPKKQKTECTSDAQCEKDKAACDKSEASTGTKKSCCEAADNCTKKDDASASKQ
jgi:hypothetical protein